MSLDTSQPGKGSILGTTDQSVRVDAPTETSKTGDQNFQAILRKSTTSDKSDTDATLPEEIMAALRSFIPTSAGENIYDYKQEIDFRQKIE